MTKANGVSGGEADGGSGADVDPAAASTFGLWLRRQREARAISLREIADSTKISVRYLEALEQDRFDVLPAQVFVRGFLREYARFVGLDPDEAINHFLASYAVPRPAAGAESPAPRRRAAPSAWGYGLLLGLAVVIFLAIAAILSFYARRRNESAAPAPTSLVPPAQAAAVAPPAPAASATAAPGATAGDSLRVVLDFSQDCWVEFLVDGTRRTSELRAGGESLAIEARDSVEIVALGNARGVRMSVNGRPWPLPDNESRVVRNLRIDRAALAAPGGPGAARPESATTP
jgi:cytoskeletal protein RodZ